MHVQDTPPHTHPDLERRLDRIEGALVDIRADVRSLTNDVQALSGDVRVLTRDVHTVTGDVQTLTIGLNRLAELMAEHHAETDLRLVAIETLLRERGTNGQQP